MTITIIIPNYNGKHLLEKNLPSVISAAKAYKEGLVDIVISDDQSTDESVIFLQSLAKEEKIIPIKVVVNKGKRGFSCNVNDGVSEAKGDVLLLLNTDAVPEKNFLNPLIRHFSDENVFAVGCLEETADDNGYPKKYGRSIGGFVRGFVIHESADALSSNKTFWVSCGSGAFRKTIWDKLNGLDEIYNPFYWEDIDLSYRAVKSGYTIIFEKESIVQHYHVEGSIKKNYSREKVRMTAYRNQIIFMWKNITDKKMLFQNLLWIPYYGIKTLSEGNIAFFSGFLAAIFFLPNIIESRQKAKKLFRLSDREVLHKQTEKLKVFATV